MPRGKKKQEVAVDIPVAGGEVAQVAQQQPAAEPVPVRPPGTRCHWPKTGGVYEVTLQHEDGSCDIQGLTVADLTTNEWHERVPAAELTFGIMERPDVQ